MMPPIARSASLSLFIGALALAGLFCARGAWAQVQDVDLSSATRLQKVQDAVQSGDPSVVAGLAAGFASETEPTIRAWILRAQAAAAASGNADAQDLLEKGLSDPSRAVRVAAAVALGKSGTSRAEAALEGALSTSSDSDLRLAAAFWLSRFKTAGSVSALAARLASDPNANVRAEAAQALSRGGTKAAKQALEQAALDPDERVRKITHGP